tara:strand:- start:96 stop:548 length:453 start_codon:yes stop_codon:yes gene_type:complete
MPKVEISSAKGLVQSAGSGFTFNGVASALSTQSVAAPAAGAAATASRILNTTQLALVSQANDANDRAYLPSPTAVPTGHWVIVTDIGGAGFELSSEGDGTTATTINGTAVTNSGGGYIKELAVAADQTIFCTKAGANAWICGTASATVPD